MLLPALDSRTLPTWAEDFLRAGGRTLLLGESRAEYVARMMSEQRRRTEQPAHFTALTDQAAEVAGVPVLVAVDQELGGIQRLHGLVPSLPDAATARAMPADDLVATARATGEGARRLGVGMFLSPVLDVLTGENPWLAGRTMGADPGEVARVAAGFVQGVQQAGVLATAKHFPGYRALAADPALTDTALTGNAAELEPGLTPFRAAIGAGVGAVMLGPAVVTALDRHQPASTSPAVVRLLREELGFAGLVVTDDVDAPATHRGRSVPGTAVAALAAGADLVLLAGGPELGAVAEQIEAAVADGRLAGKRLSEAADRVRRHAHRPTPPGVPPGRARS